ncbi:hypothetical protein JCM10213_001869 [Rhodosporidiobolus nylandii]
MPSKPPLPSISVTPATPVVRAQSPSPGLVAAAAAPGQGGGGEEPLEGDPVEIEFLLGSGSRFRVVCGAAETVERARARAWEGWPEEWHKTDPRPSSPSFLRLLYLGRILDLSSTLSYLQQGAKGRSCCGLCVIA